jgi:hypothetical protein
MKRVLILQIVINIVGFILFVFLSLGKMVEFKYNYEDPVMKATASKGTDFLYSTLREFGILLIIVIAFNLVISIVLKKRYVR